MGFLLNRFSVVIPLAEESECLFFWGWDKERVGSGMGVGGLWVDLQHSATLFASSLLLHRKAC